MEISSLPRSDLPFFGTGFWFIARYESFRKLVTFPDFLLDFALFFSHRFGLVRFSVTMTSLRCTDPSFGISEVRWAFCSRLRCLPAAPVRVLAFLAWSFPRSSQLVVVSAAHLVKQPLVTLALSLRLIYFIFQSAFGFISWGKLRPTARTGPAADCSDYFARKRLNNGNLFRGNVSIVDESLYKLRSSHRFRKIENILYSAVVETEKPSRSCNESLTQVKLLTILAYVVHRKYKKQCMFKGQLVRNCTLSSSTCS